MPICACHERTAGVCFDTLVISTSDILNSLRAPVAQPDRAPGFEPGGRGFDPLRAYYSPKA
jgi:hypothetical protein